ncbi:MAG: VCBS repeat-containing protein [Phycisphaerae bacterium]|nr:VCBS repeat-containing protein [Phycisphaerae bacterium]
MSPNHRRPSLRCRLAGAVLLTAAGCAKPPEPAATPAPAADGTHPTDAIVFREVAEASGISFRHDASEGQYFIVEEMGPGGALFDADGDGDLDLYLVQGGRIPGTAIGVVRPNRFYRNDGAGMFTDETEGSGAGDTGYGMGCAAADYDNDGDVDLYVTNVGPDVLLANDGTGRFTDVTESVGLGAAGFSTSAAFTDYDGDGHLDLYVAVYIAWTPAVEATAPAPRGEPDYRNPIAYPPGQDRLYRARGDGTFEDVTDTAGVGGRPFYGLGVVSADFDHDQDADIFVANDHQANFLWRNEGDGTFREVAMEAGCAYNGDGQPEAGMGIVCEDVDRDGDFDLLLMHFSGETNTFYRNEGGLFTDDTRVSRLADFGVADTGFGAGWLDADLDTEFELFIANGAVNRPPVPIIPDEPYAERNRLLAFNDTGRFEDITTRSGSGLELAAMSRGALFGDIDEDGDVDIVVTNNRGPVHVLRNETRTGRHWLAVRAVGVASNRDAIGAIVRAEIGDRVTRRLVTRHDSYCSSRDPRVHFGLGAARTADVTIAWPSGRVDDFGPLAADRVHVLREGDGTPVTLAGDPSVPANPAVAVDAVDVLRERAERQRQRGAWLEAALTLERAVAAAGDVPAEATAQLHRDLGDSYLKLRDYTRAAAALGRAYEIFAAIRGRRDVRTAIALSEWSTALSKEGRLGDAERGVREALAILEEQTGADSIFAATARRDLAAVLVSQNRLEAARDEYTFALELYERHLGVTHAMTRDIARSLDAVRGVLEQRQR